MQGARTPANVPILRRAVTLILSLRFRYDYPSP
jgi:hypothetical protein